MNYNRNTIIKNSSCDIPNLSKLHMYKEVIVSNCPHCGSIQFIKHGSYNNMQRYKCKSCNHTFSKVTNTLWQYSKKTPELWNDFVRMVFEQKSLRYCAKKLKINIITAFKWRHKVLFSLGNLNNIKEFNGDIHMESIFLVANNKGNYRKNRPNYVRGKNRLIRLADSDLIDIIGVHSTENQMLLIPNRIIKERWSRRTNDNEVHFDSELAPKISKKIYIKAYHSKESVDIAIKHDNKLPKKIKLEKGYKDKKITPIVGVFFSMGDNIKNDSIIRFLKRTICKYLYCYKGVSTKYLQQYFNLLVNIIPMNNIDKLNILDICKSLIIQGKFIAGKNIFNIDIFESKLIYEN